MENIKKHIGKKLWIRAKKVIPSGNSLLSKNPNLYHSELWPTYYKKAKGCEIYSMDNKKFIDVSMMGVGTNILGYSYKPVDDAVLKVIKNSNMSTLNPVEEIYLSEELLKLNPWAGMCRFARTGGEANAIAIRIARAYTKKENVAVCGYHGWHDWYLALNLRSKKQIEKLLLKNLKTEGVAKSLKNSIYTFEYNDVEKVKYLIDKKNVGTIMMEVSRNYYPKNNFLKEIRILCNKNRVILIFDECSSGFRENLGGLHRKFKVNPDMCMYGKALGNGYAITSIVGKKKIMLSSKNSFISSTFWSERIGFVAGLKTISEMRKKKSYKYITKMGRYIKKSWLKLAKKNHLEIEISGIDALPNFKFKKNHQFLRSFITHEMLKDRYLATTNIYVSLAHTKKIIDNYLNKLDKIFLKISLNKKNLKKIYKGKVASSTFDRLN
ncbi:aminotransferase class III-fold pyridoxal phosphate-dependent enzyme [Candidatus Pelagibacter sp.]|nr:aminotransferase class III-fold pyridoxal phosphate-dependent enzyme [Candidatus Pelagibacter sp.]